MRIGITTRRGIQGKLRKRILKKRSRSASDHSSHNPMKSKLIVLVALILASCTLEHKVSRVQLPGTALAVVVVEDEKSLYRYRIYPKGEPADGRIFGERRGRDRGSPLPTPVVTRMGDIVSITWPGLYLNIQIDVVHGLVVKDSNDAETPPKFQL